MRERHPLYVEVGLLLRQRRKELQLRQTEVAHRVGMARSGLFYIETGVYRPSLLDLIELCAVLRLNPGEVLGEAWNRVRAAEDASAVPAPNEKEKET